MSFAGAMSDEAIVELAVEFFRAPARFPGLRNPSQPLPGDPSILLRLANGMSPESLGLPSAADTEVDLREAAYFFVQQVLLAPGADYFRIHGLGAGASEEEIKENHRLLMRIFHPDREFATSNDWRDSAASRINQAYAVLRDPGQRAEYERTLLASDGVAALSPRRAPPAMRVRTFRSDRGVAAPSPLGRYVWRRLPQFIMGATVVIAAAGVTFVWLTNRPTGAIGSGGARSPAPVVTADPLPAIPRDVAAAPPKSIANTVIETQDRVRAPDPAPKNASTDISSPAPRPAIVAATPQPLNPKASYPAAAPSGAGERRLDVGRPVERELESRLRIEASIGTRVDKESIADRNPSSNQMVGDAGAVPPQVRIEKASTAEGVVSSDRVGDAKPTTVVPDLARRYARGDLDAFMALFDANARNESGGYSKIRKDYDELFTSTSTRHLQVSDMTWTHQDGDIWKGEGRFQARVQRNDETATRQYSGSIRLEVVMQGDRPAIRALYHAVSDSAH